MYTEAHSQNTSISIIPYSAQHREHFKKLNQEWIMHYFELEEPDMLALENPEGHILEKGGHIVMAGFNGDIVGTCALIKTGHNEFELAKMAVNSKGRGKGIGYLLGAAVIDIARKEGAAKVELLSNRILLPALNLYRKLGFVEVPLPPNDYKRADIKMVLEL
jgi:GNAT superfamily N-acetyltransferase